MSSRCGHCADCLETVRNIYERRNRSPSNTETSPPTEVSKNPTMATLTPDEEADLIAKSEKYGIGASSFLRFRHKDPVFNSGDLVGNLIGFICHYCDQLPGSEFSFEMAPEIYRLLKTQCRRINSLPEPEAKEVLASFKTPYDALAYLISCDKRSSFWRQTGMIDAKGMGMHLGSVQRALRVLYTRPREQTRSTAANAAGGSRKVLVAEAQDALAEAQDVLAEAKNLLAEAKDVLKTKTAAGSNIDELNPKLEALIGRVVVETARVTARLEDADDNNGPAGEDAIHEKE